MAVQTQIQTRRGTATTWTSTNPTLAAGEIGFESNTGKIKIGTGSTAWNALAYTASSTAVTYLFNATAAQTTFSGTDANGLTLAYTVGSEQVYLNGVLQVRGSDYTATNGTSIVLTSGALVSDVLNVIAFSALSLSDTYTQAQADAKFFQNANAFVAGKNKIINGDFNTWQRGTSFSAISTSQYTSDRWLFQNNGTGTATISRQNFTPGAAPIAGYEYPYFYQMATNSVGTSTVFDAVQRIEDVTTFAGQTVTLSFFAKADSARTIDPFFGQNFGSGGSSTVNTFGTSITLTTSWARYSQTFTLPSISGKTIGTSSFLTVALRTTPAASAVISIFGVQVEAGSVATAFQTATGTIQGELAACQRYYYRIPYSGASQIFGTGQAFSTTAGTIWIQYPVTMRTSPTALEQSGTAANYALLNAAGSTVACNTVPVFAVAYPNGAAVEATVASGLVAGNATRINAAAGTPYLGWSAEL
jgi:hypothetical protein